MHEIAENPQDSYDVTHVYCIYSRGFFVSNKPTVLLLKSPQVISVMSYGGEIIIKFLINSAVTRSLTPP